MTSLRGLWQDCAEWDRRYQTEIDRTNMSSDGRRSRARMEAENRSAGGDACDVPPAGQHPAERGRQ